MAFGAFLLEAVLISLSGVMSPGPITAVAVGKGSESPHAGAWVAIGHGAVEFPLIVSIFYGFGSLLNLPYVKTAIAFAGGLLLFIMGIGMFRTVKRVEMSSNKIVRFPVLAGMLLSAGNPFFLIWWATVGAALISRSIRFGTWGFLSFVLVHWSCDLLWCYFLSALAFKGGRFFGYRFQKAISVICGIFFLFFGGKFLTEAVSVFLA